MAFGKCGVCSQNQAKYKCPKTSVEYCSLQCFKQIDKSKVPATAVESTDTIAQSSDNKESIGAETQNAPETSVNETIANDPVIKSLLNYKALRVHLGVVLKLLQDSSITREPLYENRKEIANMRLCDLRVGGSEENELVEEFVQRVLYLSKEQEA